ncbi:hypothetical protein HER15_13235 [Tenacibaculum mesophilum]|uniref:Peptidase M43 pregnancy-associated plasma-A domain-containing protein n=1 Tax=Tenacibaculum mesophilum TaxID=104268 RepID=A0AAE9MRM8_9FLAO|nr:M43 family zinc metalloprotease [Tenacibaculum mesophilum]UTD16375.1 hypothetical protein HER15_13235 [Tenacibaculum mesophilum]
MKKTFLITTLFSLLFACSSETKIDLPENPEPPLDNLEVYTLPVVVHIIHGGESIGEGFNLATERIKEQIQSLNHDFRRVAGTLGENNSPHSSDSFIQFKLAEIDPNGNPTNGINRINYYDNTPVRGDKDRFDWLPEFEYWNPNKYINIWVYGGYAPNTFAGAASFPTTNLPGIEDELKTIGDGILINVHHFGKSDVSGGLNLGKTLTHEMGHFLGLLHIWGAALEGKPCYDHDDFIEDTPPVSGSINGCNGAIPKACDEQPAPVNNYMNLTDDRCMNVFTKGQIKRMRYVLEHAERRKTLITSDVISR